MKIKSAAENEAILSNVGQIGEFRIRNSAKAFGILSSGLYANKIRAIIREYSCNAFDSHVEAGRAHCPFEVHLPNSLDPYFAVRDFGVGLDNDQVVNIFTTYFESTKTDSNDVIGGLGLGSKSAFSYTDNFTITAVKAGVKRIYTAFINEAGVPSVALMTEEATDEASGVEIRFAVSDSWDFRKFQQEAASVFRTFPVKPTVTGVDNFEFDTVEYEIENIIPGVNVMRGRYHRNSEAIMGNISYPLDIPNAEQNLGSLASLLSCNLEITFDIGELDIQASREGLSYIPETIAAIRSKLQAVNDRLESWVAEEADQIDCAWTKAQFLANKSRIQLTTAAVDQYVANNPTPLITKNSYYRHFTTAELTVNVDKLAEWNINLVGFQHSPYRDSKSAIRPHGYETVEKTVTDDSGKSVKRQVSVQAWQFGIDSSRKFVVSDLKRGELLRAKYHWSNDDAAKVNDASVYVLSPVDKTRPMNTAAFFAALHEPPAAQRFVASELMERVVEKASKAAQAATRLVSLQKRNPNGYSWRSRDNDMVWRDAGTVADLPDTATYYYVPVKGFKPEFNTETIYGADSLLSACTSSGLPGLANIKLYGVRKADLETVKSMGNWVNIEDHVKQVLDDIGEEIILQLAVNAIDKGRFFSYNADIVSKVSTDSPYVDLVSKLAAVGDCKIDQTAVARLLKMFGMSFDDLSNKVSEKATEYKKTVNRYPLLTDLNSYANTDNVAAYINLVDNSIKE